MSDRSYFSRVIIESASDHKQSRPSKAGGFFHASSNLRLRRSFSLMASAFPLHTCQLESTASPLLLAVGVRLPAPHMPARIHGFAASSRCWRPPSCSTHASSNPRLRRFFSLMASAFPLHTCQLESAASPLLLAVGVRHIQTRRDCQGNMRAHFPDSLFLFVHVWICNNLTNDWVGWRGVRYGIM